MFPSGIRLATAAAQMRTLAARSSPSRPTRADAGSGRAQARSRLARCTMIALALEKVAVIVPRFAGSAKNNDALTNSKSSHLSPGRSREFDDALDNSPMLWMKPGAVDRTTLCQRRSGRLIRKQSRTPANATSCRESDVQAHAASVRARSGGVLRTIGISQGEGNGDAMCQIEVQLRLERANVARFSLGTHPLRPGGEVERVVGELAERQSGLDRVGADTVERQTGGVRPVVVEHDLAVEVGRELSLRLITEQALERREVGNLDVPLVDVGQRELGVMRFE